MKKKPKPDDAEIRRQAAEALERQIDEMLAGHVQTPGPKSFRDFVEEKMAEDRKKGSASDEPADAGTGEALGRRPKPLPPRKRK